MKAPEQIREVERIRSDVATARHLLLKAGIRARKLDLPSVQLHFAITVDNCDDLHDKLGERLDGKQMEQDAKAIDLDAHRKRQRSGGGRW